MAPPRPKSQGRDSSAAPNWLRRPAQPDSPSASHNRKFTVDGNPLHRGLRVGGFRQRHGQDAVLERGADLILVDAVDGDAPFETAVVTLAKPPFLVLGFGLLLTLDGEGAVGEFDRDILLVKARQVRRGL